MSNLKKEAKDKLRETMKKSKKQAHSGQGDTALKAQAKTLENFIKDNPNLLQEFKDELLKEAKRLRSRAGADRHN